MRTMDMTKGAPYKRILRFAGPLLVGTLFQQVYNLVDTMVVGYGIDENAVAAIGTTSALYSVLVNFAVGMNNGFGIIVARLFGAHEKKRLRQATASMLLLDMVISVLLTVLSLPLLSMLLHWLDTPQDIFSQAYTYIFIILAGLIATIGYNMAAGFMRAIGNSRTPVYILIISCGINIALDILFVIVLKIGVAGAALATVFAEAISTVLGVVYIWKHYQPFLPEREDWRLDGELIKEMLETGLSMGMMLSLFSIGSIILQKGINSLGTAIITGHTASRRIFEMMCMLFSTVSASTATFVSQNFGAKREDRIYQGIRQMAVAQMVISIFGVIVIFVLGESMIRLLIGTNNMEVIRPGLLNLKIGAVFYFPLGMLLLLRNAMQPMGFKIAPVISSSIELVFKVVFTIFLIPRAGYIGVAITEPVTWVVCFIFLLVVLVKNKGIERRS